MPKHALQSTSLGMANFMTKHISKQKCKLHKSVNTHEIQVVVVVARERREAKIFLGIFLDVNLIALNHGNVSCLANIQCFL